MTMYKRTGISLLLAILTALPLAAGGGQEPALPDPAPAQPDPAPTQPAGPREPDRPAEPSRPSQPSEPTRPTQPSRPADTQEESTPPQASPVVGSIVFLDGDVTVQRDGRFLAGEEVDFGLAISNYDLVATRAASLAEVELSTPAASGVSVTIDENTAFYFEVADIGGTPQTDFSLLAGSIAFRVAQVTGTGSVNVRTGTTVLGVRGTEFKVDAAPDGSLLVTVAEGAVALADGDEEELRLEPGTAAQKLEGEVVALVPVAVSDIETFRSTWYAERIEAFRANALRAVRFYANGYEQGLDAFTQAYDGLMAQREILNRWDKHFVDGTRPSASARLRDNRVMSPALLQVRRSLFIFERVYYRLLQLRDLHDNEGLGRGDISSGYTTTEFFADLAAQEQALGTMMARVRHAYRLYDYINPDSPLRELFGGTGADELTDPDDFFSDPDDFFGGQD